MTAAQAGEASTVTPPVLQGPGARTVPGNVTAPIMECVITVSTQSADCKLKKYFLPLSTSHASLERKFSVLMTEVCPAQCLASVSARRGSRASTARRCARRRSSVSGAPTAVTATPCTARAATTSRANVSVARAGEVS